jgi:hypothetical protein
MTRFADCLADEMKGSPDVETTEEAPAATEEAAPTVASAEPSTAVGDSGVPGASSGVSTAQAEDTVPSASSGASTATSERPTDDVLDLGEASREAVLKRAVPVVGAIVALLILLRIIRR